MDEAIARIEASVVQIVPEVVLVLTACGLFLASAFAVPARGEPRRGIGHAWAAVALAAIGFAAWLGLRPVPASGPTYGPFALDTLAVAIRGIALATVACLHLISWRRVDDRHAGEFHACLLLIAAGTSLVGLANDLTVLFLALELVSLPTYVLLFLARHDASGEEATLKYFLLSVFSSAILLFGFAYLYGVTGTTNLAAIRAAFAGQIGEAPLPLTVGVAAILVGLAFRLAAVPFHVYAPDVMAGTTTTGAALLATVPKVVGIVALIRLFVGPVLGAGPLWESLASVAMPLLTALAVLSMCAGNCLALLQTDLRRLMAYSGIAHAGYMLVGLTTRDGRESVVGGVSATLYYLPIYLAMTVGVFAVVAAIRRPGVGRVGDPDAGRVDRVTDLAGLGQTHPFAAAMMAVFLFSLTGLPPTAGFWGKFNLILAAWSGGVPWLAVLLAVNAGIAAWYYLRLIGTMYLAAPDREDRRPADLPPLVAAVVCAAVTIVLFAAPDWLWSVLPRLGG